MQKKFGKIYDWFVRFGRFIVRFRWAAIAVVALVLLYFLGPGSRGSLARRHIFVIGVALLLFGPRRLPQLGRSLALPESCKPI